MAASSAGQGLRGVLEQAGHLPFCFQVALGIGQQFIAGILYGAFFAHTSEYIL